MNEKQARKHIKALKGFYAHLTTYVAVNLFLLAINLLTSPGVLWVVFPALGWGIGLAIHASQVFFTSKDWEARKLEELTGLRETKEEVARLAERTDALVSIMASVDWEKIDPELASTRRSLESAQQRLGELKAGNDPEGQAAVREEIERLEAFVTSSKFAYYDMASKG